jgi:glyoxylase-like metal-dependent hydrolase (beta-lactamase superfamily II)
MASDQANTVGVAPDGIEITGTAQRQAWLERTMPPVEQLRTDLWSIPVPIPNSPLRYMSAYVFAGPGGLTLIDAGWQSDAGWEALTAGLAALGGSMADVRGVLVTHMHFDHIGLAGRVREASGAWIALHSADGEIVARPAFRDARLAADQQVAWLRSVGAPDDVLDEVTPEALERFTHVALPDRLLEDGDRPDVPGWQLRAVHTPGHTPGHLCFADEGTGLFFSGDHVLPRITPNISANRHEADDPLGNFLHSLQAIRSMEATEVLPAHEWRFRGLAERVDQIAMHHAHRLDELAGVVADHPGSVPWELAGHLRWSRSWDQYDGHLRIMAVNETVAHLWRLVAAGRITRTDGPQPRYHPAA